MRPTTPSPLCGLWLAGLTFLSLARTAAAAPSGWDPLWRNQDGAARTQFRAALKQNPADAGAWRGLATLAMMEDDEQGAVLAWRALYHVAPAQERTAAGWPQFVEAARETGRWDLLADGGRDVLAAPDAAPGLRASARLALAAAADRAGRAAEAGRQWRSLGYVRDWQAIGPFDNASRSGFEKAYPPEEGRALNAACFGKDGQALRWHRLALVGRDGQCAIGKSLGDGDPDVFYAATALRAPRAETARLQFDPAGASKVWVNGALVFSDPLIRAHQALVADPFSLPVSLRAGPNAILIKLADDESTAAGFALRVTAPDGSMLRGVTADPTQAAITPVFPTPAPGAAIGTWSAPLETVTEAALRRLPADPEVAALRGDLLRREADDLTSAGVLRDALRAAPNSGWLRWQLAQTLYGDGQTDEARAARDLALKANPRLVEAARAEIAQTDDGLTPADRVARLKALHALVPASPDALWSLAHAYADSKLAAPALAAGRQALALAGGDDSVTELAGLYADLDRSAAATALLTGALKASPGAIPLLEARADALAEGNDPAPAIPLYERLRALEPPATQHLTTLAKLYQDRRADAAAIQTLRLARQERPQDGDICAALADLLETDGRRAEAASLYREAIRLDPAELSLRDKLAVLTGEKPVIDLAPATPSAPILAGAAKAEAAGGASALVLLDEARTVVYPDSATLTRFHQIIKILDHAAAVRYESYPLSRPSASATATVERARLIKADGKVQDMSGSQPTSGEDGGNAVAFPSLSPGDVLDIAYRVENYQRGALAHQFWDQWYFDEMDAPNRLSRYVLITPPGLNFQAQAHGAVAAPTVKDVGGWRVHEWRMADVPPLRQEMGGTGRTDSGRWLDVSTLTSWRQVVDWYRDLSAPRCMPDEAVQAKAQELTQGCATEADKIRALTAFVARDIQYQSSPFRMSAYVPTEGKQVLRERYGDCKDKAALLTALLGAVGIHSDMVLLSPRRYGVTPFLPSPRFSHAIARVQTAQGPLWVDATADQMSFGDLPDEDQQVPALVIAPGTTDLAPSPALPLRRDVLDDTYTCALDARGRLRGQANWDMRGTLAWGMRSAWRDVPADRQDQALRYVAGSLFKNATYDSGGMDNLAELEKPLTLHVQYHTDRFGTTAGSFLLAPLPWSEQGRDKALDALQATPDRTQDVEVADSRGRFHSVLDLTLPAGYVPQELPAEVKGDSSFGSYRFTYHMDGTVLHAERDLSFTALRVPGASLPQYTAFLQTIEQEGQRELVLKR